MENRRARLSVERRQAARDFRSRPSTRSSQSSTVRRESLPDMPRNRRKRPEHQKLPVTQSYSQAASNEHLANRFDLAPTESASACAALPYPSHRFRSSMIIQQITRPNASQPVATVAFHHANAMPIKRIAGKPPRARRRRGQRNFAANDVPHVSPVISFDPSKISCSQEPRRD